MANTTPDKMRALLVPTANISKSNLWAAQSTYTQQNPRAGVAKPQQNSRGLVVQCAGEQSQDITITTQDGGTPGETATFIWSGQDATKLGQVHNNCIMDWKYIAFESTPGKSFNDFDAIATDDGSIYVVTEYINGTIYTIQCRKQTREGAVSVVKTFVTTSVSGSPNTTAKPSICELKDGSLLVAYFDYTSSDYVNLFVWRSYDNGVNWQKISNRALDNGIYVKVADGKLIEKSNLIVTDDTVTLAVSVSDRITVLGDNSLVQFVSRDSGTSFRGIGNYATGTYHQASAVTLPQGQIGFAYISDTDKIGFTAIPHPGITAGDTEYKALREVTVSTGVYTFATLTNDVLFNGELTSWYQDGVLYILAKTTNDIVYGWMSDDLGVSWEYIDQTVNAGIAPPYVYNPQSSTAFTNLKSVVWEGRAVILTKTFTSIGMLYLGGWSSWTPSPTTSQQDRGEYHGWRHNWVHNQTPDTSTQYTTTGTGSATLVEEGLKITSLNIVRYYTYGGSLSPQQSYNFRMRVEDGDLFGADRIAVSNNWDNGANSYEMHIRFGTSGWRVADHTGNLHTENTDMTKLTEFTVFHSDQDVLVYYRQWDEKQAKKWTVVSITIGAQAAGAVPSQLVWGHIVSSLTNTFTSYWSDFHISKQFVGEPAKELRGCNYPALGEYTYIDEGLLLTAKESPARAEETYLIEARYDFPIDNIFHQIAMSPRLQWRSVDTSSTERIAWYTDPNVQATSKTLGLSDVVGLHLSGINWRTANLQMWTGAAWSTIHAIDTSVGLQSTFTRIGATLQSSASNAPFYLFYDEARGWSAELDDGVSKYIVQIQQNSEGMWDISGKHKPCVLLIDTNKTDVSTLPTSGDIKLMPTSYTIISELFQSIAGAGAYAYALEITTQSTIDGWYQIGTMMMGNLYFMAPQYQRGRTITLEPNIETMDTMDNIFWGRKLSEGSRVFSLAWTEPIDTRSVYSKTADYWQFSTSANTQPVATYGDAPMGMVGLCRYLSNITPVVYLPSIAKSTGADDIQVFNRYHNQSLVRTTGSVSMESVLGNEEQDEMFRVATINFEEII